MTGFGEQPVPSLPAAVDDPLIIRQMRRDLVHEKAVRVLTADKIRLAQNEAKKALSFVRKVGAALRYVP